MELTKEQQELQDESNRIIKTAFIRDAKISSTIKRSFLKDMEAEDLVKVLKEESFMQEFHKGIGFNVSGKRLGEITNQTPAQIREIIHYIRIYSDDLLNKGEYLIANNKGYEITENEEDITKFFHKTHSRAKNTTAQVMQMAKLFPKLLGGL